MPSFGTYERPDEFIDTFPTVCLGIQNHSPQTGIHSHWHERYEIIQMRKGLLQIACGNEYFEALPGDMIFINPTEIHMGRFLEPEDQTFILVFDLSLLTSGNGDPADRMLCDLLSGRLRIRHLIRGNDRLNAQAEWLNSLIGNPSANLLQVKAGIMDMLGTAIAGNAVSLENNCGHGDSCLLSKLLAYVHKYYAEPLTLQDLADYIGFSKTHFCRWFKKLVGEPPMNYLNTVRLKKAHELLIQTSLTMTDIAVCCGFQSSNYFSRKFKEHFGVAPSSVREEKNPSL